MKDFEAALNRLALNRLFRKAKMNRFTECRVCNFKDRSIIVVNAACNDETSYEITEVIINYQGTNKDVRMLVGNYIYPLDASPESAAIEHRLWVLV